MCELVWSQWSEDHISDHNVLPAEVEQVVNSRPRYTAKGRDETTLVYGRTDAGRYLLVVLADGPGRRLARRHGSRHERGRAPRVREEGGMTMDKTPLQELAEYYDTHSTAEELEGATFEPGAAPPRSERMTTFAVRLPVDMLERARDLARKQNMTVSALLRQWIFDGMVRTARKVDTRGHGPARDAFVNVEDVAAAFESLASKARPLTDVPPARHGEPVSGEREGSLGEILGYVDLHMDDPEQRGQERVRQPHEGDRTRQETPVNDG